MLPDYLPQNTSLEEDNATFSNPFLTTEADPNTNNVPLDPTFSKFFTDDDDELALTQARRNGNTQVNRYNIVNIEKALEDSLKDLRLKYPMGGLKASRFITADILLTLNEGYFDKYDDTVKKGVDWVQTHIAEAGKAFIIGAAQEEPTDEEKQEAAFRVVQTSTGQYLDNHSTARALDRAIITSLICNEIIGFSRLDPLWRDTKIDEIICNGPKDIQVEIGGIIYRVPSCSFRDKDHLMNLIERLYSAIGKIVSKTTPIVDGRLHDNSRMAVVHSSVAPEGPNFNIRRHKENYISPERLVTWESASPELLTFLGNLIYKGCSILILGGTSSGKTTLLGALSGYLRPDHRILTLEDNLELKLAPHKLKAAAMECLPARADSPNSGVNMRDLVKASLRLRPNAIIVGEVRDGSAFDLCQSLNTGHYGMSTIHANSDYDGIYRLVSLVSQGGLMQGDAALPLIAASFDFIVRIERFPSDGSRKIVSISEVAPFPARKESGELTLPTRTLWKFVDEGVNEHLKVLGHWEQVGEIGKERKELRRLDLEKWLTWDALKTLAQ